MPVELRRDRPATGATLPEDPIYAAWVSMFSEPGYDDLVGASTGLLDRLAADAGPTERARCSAVFIRSTYYEVEFWDMAYRGAGEPS